MATAGWIDRPKPKSKTVVWAAAGLIAVAVLIDVGIDRGDSPSWTATVLNSILFSAKRILHIEEAPRGPEAWSTPNPAEFKSFVDSLNASPRAAEIGRTLLADPYVRDRWIAYQRTQDSTAFFNSIQGYKPLQQTIADLAAQPENAEVRKLVAVNPVGQALLRRFPSATGRASLQAAAQTTSSFVAPGASRGTKGRGAYVVGSDDGTSGSFGPGEMNSGLGVVDSQNLGSGGADAGVPRQSDGYNGYLSQPIRVPKADNAVSVDATRCGVVNVVCASGTVAVCGSANRWSCVTPPNDCGALNVACAGNTRASCISGQWHCVTAGTCEPSGHAPQCSSQGAATWDGANCRWSCPTDVSTVGH